MARKTVLKPDKNGNYCREIGYLYGQNGKQPRFNFGKNQDEAEKRQDRLLKLMSDIEVLTDGKPFWSEFGLYAARLLAKGETRIPYCPQESELADCEDNIETVSRYVCMMRQMQDLYPSLTIVASHPEMYEDGVFITRCIVKQQVEKLQEVLQEENYLPATQRLPERIIQGTVHEVMDRYITKLKSRAVEQSRKPKPWDTKKVEIVERLKNHQSDIQLTYLDFDVVNDWVAYWRNSPMSKRGKPMAKATKKVHLSELRAFLRWMSRSGVSEWKLPEGFADLKWTPFENTNEPDVKKTKRFTIDQLTLLNKYATPKERLFLLLGINCGFCPAEMGSLRLSHIYLRQPHPEAELVEWDATTDSFIRIRRPKTNIYGEYLLFEQTAKVVENAVLQRRAQGANDKDLLFINSEGEPAYDRDSGRTSIANFFSNPFNSLVKRVRKDYPDFPRYSIRSLRRTAASLMRRHFNDELSSTLVMHGSTGCDDMIDIYAERGFARLFRSLQVIEAKLEVVFAAAPTNLFAQPRQQYTSLAVQEHIQELLQNGVAISEIAKQCQVPKATVYRERKLLSENTEGTNKPNI